MSDLLGPQGKPITKEWKDMTIEEQLGSIRQAMGWIIKNQEVMMSDVNDIIQALDEYAEDEAKTAQQPEAKS